MITVEERQKRALLRHIAKRIQHIQNGVVLKKRSIISIRFDETCSVQTWSTPEGMEMQRPGPIRFMSISINYKEGK